MIDIVDEFATTAPGTLAGRYLRQFWQPIYHSCDLAPERPIPLRIMSEDFTLYRGASGQPYLVAPRCPHRGTRLNTAWVQGDALRCFYHGWKFSGDGICLEQPAEDNRFCHNTPIAAYPTEEYLGLIFAFLGEGAPPPLPRYLEFENFEGLLELDSYQRACNYFQNLENALDMSHVGFTHGDNQVAFNGIGRGRDLTADETAWGIKYSFHRPDGAVRTQQFGMPNIFYMTALPNDPDIGWQESLFWWVPIDDTQHMQFSLHRVPATPDAAARIHARRDARRASIDIPHQEACAKILAGDWHLADLDKSRVDLVRLQDDIAQIGQGISANRHQEKLGGADIGVVVIRKLWRRELTNLRAGTTTKTWLRDETIKLTVWQLDGKDTSLSADNRAATPALVDVRPHIERTHQLRALHGQL
jgi:5,5'-dehydrodivanillate O-demethylase